MVAMLPESAGRACRTDRRPECAACARLTDETLSRRRGLGHTALRPPVRARGVGGKGRRTRCGRESSWEAVLRRGTGFCGGHAKDFGDRPPPVTRPGPESDHLADAPPKSDGSDGFVRSRKDEGATGSSMPVRRCVCSTRLLRCENTNVDLCKSRQASGAPRVPLAWVLPCPLHDSPVDHSDIPGSSRVNLELTAHALVEGWAVARSMKLLEPQ